MGVRHGKKHIDLLPERVQKRKGFRRLVIKLAAIQVAVFLCIAAAVAGLSALERQTWDSSHELQLAINTLRQGQAVAAAAYARELSLRIAAEDAFIAVHGPAAFDPGWLSAILLLEAGHMTNFHYTGIAILITGMSGDINAIEAHRQSIRDARDFRAVDLGRVMLQDCGRYFYELWVRL